MADSPFLEYLRRTGRLPPASAGSTATATATAPRTIGPRPRTFERRPRSLSFRSPPIDASEDAAAAAAAAAAESTPAESAHGPLRQVWDAVASPFKAFAGVDQSALVQLLGVKNWAPEQYDAAVRELRRNITGGVDRELGPLESAEALPGVGDILAQTISPETRESVVGRTLGPVARIAGNIAGSPTTYLGGLGALTKVGRASKAIAEVRAGITAAETAGDVAKAAELSSKLPALGGALMEAAGAEGSLGRAARSISETAGAGATGRAFTELATNPSFPAAIKLGIRAPFGPATGVAFAPELLESVADQGAKTIEDVKAGRYAEAASSGVGAALTAGLGALVGKGVMDEFHAAKVLENALARQLGDRQVASTEAAAETAPVAAPEATPAAPAPAAAPTPATALEAAPATAPRTESATPPLNPLNPVLPQAPALVASERSKRMKVKANPEAIAALVQARAGTGQPLTRGDLLAAGLVSKKQARDYSLADLLDAHGATELRAQLGTKTSAGYLVNAPVGTRSAPAAAPAPAAAIEAAGAPVAATAAPAAQMSEAPVTGVPAGATVAEIPVPRQGEALAPAPAPAAPTLEPTLEPVLTPVKLMEMAGLDEQVLRLYSEGKSYREIAQDLAEHEPDMAALATKYNEGGGKWQKVRAADSPAPYIERAAQIIVHQRGLSRSKKVEPIRTEPIRTEPPRTDASLTYRAQEPSPEVAARRREIDEGGLAEREVAALAGAREQPSGLGERTPFVEPVRMIESVDDLDAVRMELATIREISAEDPVRAEELADRDVELQDAIEGALQRGVGREKPGDLTTGFALKPDQPSIFTTGGSTPPRTTVRQALREGRAKVPAPEPSGRAVEATLDYPPEPATPTIRGGPRAGRPQTTDLTMGASGKRGVRTPVEQLPTEIAKAQPRVTEAEDVAPPARTPATDLELARAAVDRHISDTDTDRGLFADEASAALGKPVDDATPEELNHLLNYAAQYPERFGAPPPPGDPAVRDAAATRLMGTTAHLAKREKAKTSADLRPFTYDPASPAGQAQRYAQVLEQQHGIHAEDALQQKLGIWLNHLDDDLDAKLARDQAKAETAAVKALERGLAKVENLQSEGKDLEADAARAKTLVTVANIKKKPQTSYDAAKNLRRLLTGEQTPETERELTRLLHKSLDFYRNDQLRKETLTRIGGERRRTLSVEDVIERPFTAEEAQSEKGETLTDTPAVDVDLTEGLSPDERARFAETPQTPIAPEAAEGGGGGRPRYEFGYTERPTDTDPAAWRKTVQTDPAIQAEYRESLASLVQDWTEGKGTKTGQAGAPWMAKARQMAADLGLTVGPKRGMDEVAPLLEKAINAKAEGTPSRPRAQASSELLTSQLAENRGQQWADAIVAGRPIGETGFRIADLEADAPPIVDELAAAAEPVVTALSKVVEDGAAASGYPSRFAGLTVSPALNAARVGDDILANASHAWHLAEAELADSTLTGEARRDAKAHIASRNLVDESVHELVHYAVRHDPTTADRGFLNAYADALIKIGPKYAEMIRSVRDSLIPVADQFDAMAGRYAEAVTGLKERIANEASAAERTAQGRRAEGAGTRPGEGRAPTVEPGPGGDQRGAAGGGAAGVRPGVALPRGNGEPASGVRAGATDLSRPARVNDLGAEPRSSGSLTSDLIAGQQQKRTEEVREQIGRAFAHGFSKLSGEPEAADELLANLKRVESMTPEQRAEYTTAKPGRSKGESKVDIGQNMNYLSTLGLSDDLKAAMAMTLEARNSQYSRSKPVPWAQLDADTKEILRVHSPEEYVQFVKRTGLNNASDLAALRTVAVTFGKEVDDARLALRAADLKGDAAGKTAARNALEFAAARKIAALDVLIPETTNVGRMLQAMKMLVHPLTPEETFKSRFLGAMRTSRIPQNKAEQLYSMLADTIRQGPAGDWRQFTNAFREATKTSTFDKFLEFWKAGLLGIPTQAANFSSNALFAGLRTVENAVGVLADAAFSGISGAERSRHIGELATRVQGFKHGFGEGIGSLIDDLKSISTLQPPDIQSRVERGTFLDEPDLRMLQGAIGGKKGEFVRTPFKLLDAFDNFFKHISRSQEFSVQAHRLASSPAERLRLLGNRDVPISRAYSQILDEMRRGSSSPITNYKLFNKYKDQIKIANDTARADTFQAPLNDTMKKIYQGTQAHPSLQLIFPFVKTPYNVLAEGIKRTPLGVAWALRKYAKGEIDNPKFVEAMVKGGFGTAMMMLAGTAGMEGTITGSGPVDPKLTELLKRTGWQPYSFKIGDQYISYARMEPFATLLGLGADFGEAMKGGDMIKSHEIGQKFISSLSDNIGNKSMLSGFEAMTKILSDPDRSGKTAIRQLQASLVPNIVGVVPVGHLARATDPYYRETEALTTSPFQAQLPGLSQDLPAQRIPTGEPRERKGTAFERLASPFQRSEVETGPVADAAGEIVRLGIGIESPGPYYKLGDEKVYYSADERERIAKAQEKAFARIGQLVHSSAYRSLPDSKSIDEPLGTKTKRDLIMSIVQQFRGPIVKQINSRALQRARRSASV